MTYAAAGLAVAAVPAVTWVAIGSASRTSERLTCAQLSRLSQAYSSGQLDRQTREQVDQHLAHCTPCREAWQRKGLLS